MSDTTATTTPLAVWAGLGAAALSATAYSEAPWWVWVAVLSWLVLTVVAILGQSEAESRKFLSGTLRKSTYTQIYTALVGRSHDRLWAAYCDPVEKGAGLAAMFRAALTWRLYDRALLLAVVYPILLPVLWWLVTGGAAQLGPVVFLEAKGFWNVWPERVGIFCFFAFVLFFSFAQGILLANSKGMFRRILIYLISLNDAFSLAASGRYVLIVAFMVSSGVAFSILGSEAGLSSISNAMSVSLITAVAVGVAIEKSGIIALTAVLAGATGSLAVSIFKTGSMMAAILTIVVASVGMVFVAVEKLDQRHKAKQARWFVTLGAAALWLIAAAFVPWKTTNDLTRTLFLFLGVFPLINALFDVISYAVTLSFIRRGRVSRLPVLYGLADLGVAMGLFLGLGVTMVAVIAGLNGLAGADILDLGALLRDVRDQPGSYWWLYGIAFSTILPTALHAALAALGVQGLWPKGIRRVVAGWIGNASASQIDATRGAFALGFLWAAPVWVIVAAVWLAWHFGGGAAITLAAHYLTALDWVARCLGA